MLLVGAIVLTGTCLILKRKVYNLSTNSKLRVDSYKVDEIVTNTNVAYKPVQQTATVQAVNHELEVMYDTADQQGEGTTDHEPQQAATENQAYGSSTDAQISLTSNVAYNKSANPLDLADDQYDYI